MPPPNNSTVSASGTSAGLAGAGAEPAPTAKTVPVEAVLLCVPIGGTATCKAPAGSELVKLPTVDAVTFTVIVQTPGTPLDTPGIVPPVSVIVELPAVAVNVPPQVVLAPDGVAITIPLGKLSVNNVIVATTSFALLKEIILVEAPPTVMVAGVKIAPAPTPPGVKPPGHELASMTLSSMLTAAFRAKALPDTMFAP
jgi:hypothetical protein